jgi:hypothetical protein
MNFPRRKPSTRELLLQLKRQGEHLMSAVEDLTAAVSSLESAESAAAAEFAKLAGEIAALKAGTIDEATIEALAVQAQAVASKLQADTPA